MPDGEEIKSEQNEGVTTEVLEVGVTPPPVEGQEYGAEEKSPEVAASEQSEQVAKPTETEKAPEEKKPDTQPQSWWQKKGYASEQVAEEAFDNLRKFGTQASQRAARAEARAVAYRKIAMGEEAPDDAEAFVRAEEEKADQQMHEQSKRLADQQTAINAAIEWGKVVYGDEIVKPQNYPILNAFALGAPSEMTNPLDRMRFACDEFRKFKGLSAETKATVKERQDAMRKEAQLPSVKKPSAEKPKDYWAMSETEFRMERDKMLNR